MVHMTVKYIERQHTCGAWNYSHDCRLPEEHPGDHLCACGDVWNRGPWDDDAEEWEDDRPASICRSWEVAR